MATAFTLGLASNMKILWDWALESMMAWRYFSSSLLRLPLTPTIGWLQRVIVAWLSGWIHDNTFERNEKEMKKENESEKEMRKNWDSLNQWLALTVMAYSGILPCVSWVLLNHDGMKNLFCPYPFILVTPPKFEQTRGDWTGLSLTFTHDADCFLTVVSHKYTFSLCSLWATSYSTLHHVKVRCFRNRSDFL